MSKRNLFLLFVLAALFLVATVIPTKSNPEEVGLISGRNVNMVSGTVWPGGDPWLQRQNEPSIAVSTRNPLHLLAGANDYRSIDAYFEDELPGYEKESSARDAWLGVFTSYDGGQSWTSTLLPGYLYADTTPDGCPISPLFGYEAAADPVVRAGTNGLFYYCGITFNRGQRGLGKVFVARFIDNNNKETGAIEYIDTKIIDIGNSGHFIDKPWIAVDIPREGSPTTTLPNEQIVPCGNVYIVYTSFMGDLAEGAHSKMMFSMSTDCGETWSKPTQITDAGQPYQAAALAINPIDGRPFVAYRRFAKDTTDAIMLCWAEKKGKETVEGYWHGNIKFSKPIILAEIDPFDQPTSEWTFRTNDYPTMTIDKDGVIYVAWSQRGCGPNGEGKILMMTSVDGGLTWEGPALVDDPSLSGYEFMPSLTSGAGKVMILWYDQQYDVCGHFEDEYIQEFYQIRHTIDVRAAEVYPTANPYFSLETIQVSRYPWVFTSDYQTEEPIAEQLQYNMPNLRIFGGGKVPFLGDYIDITPSPMFVPQGDGWAYNTDPDSRPIYHAVWTDNRDVRPPGPGGEWWDYVAPGEGCNKPDQTGIRNQNIYTSRITEGIIAGSPGNTKPLNMDRAFVVFVKNATGTLRNLILDIGETSGATAYFMKAGEGVGTQLEVEVPPQSSVSATVMVESYSNQYATVRINVHEDSNLLTYILLNPDSTNPGIEDPEGYEPGTPHVGSDEYHTPHVGSEDVINWEYSVDSPHVGSEDATSPHVGSNDDWVTPHVGSDDDIIFGSTIHVGTNNHVILSNIVNPHVGSDDFPVSIPENSIMTDIVWTVENRGNTTSTFSLSTFPFYDYNPDQIAVQLIVYKVYTTPTALGCELKEQEHHELIVSQTSPHVGSEGGMTTSSVTSENLPDYFDATFDMPPGGKVKVILRYMDKDTTDGIELNPEDQGISVGADAKDIIGGQEIPSASALVIETRTMDLDNGIAGITYNETLEVEGGYGNYAWSLGGTAPDWLSIDSTPIGLCYISGTPTTAGTYSLTITVDDTDPVYDRPDLTITKTLSIIVYDPLNITTTSLPDGIVGISYDQTLTATGGDGNYTWSLASGSLPLPNGLSLSSTGVINGGAPTHSGIFNFTVEVTDSSNPPQTAQQPLSINVIPPHEVSLPNTPSGPTNGISGITYTYSTGGSVCSWGHNVEYRVDWDDGNQPSWSSSSSASHSWDTAGTYNITAQARCADDPYVVSGWSSTLTVTVNEPDFEVVYIYQTDTTSANSFKAALADMGIYAELLHIDNINSFTFSGYDLVLIGHDTGDYTPPQTWGGIELTQDDSRITRILESGLSVAGIGDGGGIFFDSKHLNLNIGYGGSMGVTTQTAVNKVDPAHIIWSSPNSIAGTTVEIYNDPGERLELFEEHIGPNVVALAQCPLYTTHFPIVSEDRFLQWGFVLSPDYWTQTGKDLFENTISLMASEPQVTTVAGTGTEGYSGDGGPAIAADIRSPFDVGVDAAGNIYLIDYGNNRIRKVDTNGIITTVLPGVSAPHGLGVDSSGNIYLADTSYHRIRKIDAGGNVTIVAGTGTEGYSGDGGPATLATLNSPLDVTVDSAGNIFIADNHNYAIRKVDATSGIITTVAGTGTSGDGPDGVPATSAQLGHLGGVAFDSSGNMYIADYSYGKIRKVDATSGIITTLADVYFPNSIAIDNSDNIYFSEMYRHWVRKVDAGGTVTTVAGTGTSGFNGDGGPATVIQFNGLYGIAVGSDGNIYIADTHNNRIRKVDMN
jgi:sugar lactone lactonase YvrE